MRSYIRRRGDVAAAANGPRSRSPVSINSTARLSQLASTFMAAIALTDSAMAIAASYAARVLGIDRRTTIMVKIVNAISAAVQRSIQFFHLPVSPTGRFKAASIPAFAAAMSGGLSALRRSTAIARTEPVMWLEATLQ